MPKRKINPIYVHEGFLLRFQKTNTHGSELLYCSQRKTAVGCHAFAHRDPLTGQIVLQREHERHEADDDGAKAGLVKKQLKEDAVSSSNPPRNLIQGVRNKFGVGAVAHAGSLDALGHRIHRARGNDDVTIAMANANPPQFIGAMADGEDGQRFLLFDATCQQSGGRSVCFSSDIMLETLGNSDLVLADGTFEIAPDPFEQVWVLHGKVSDDATLPIAFVLMEKKTTDDYAIVLSEIRKAPQLSTWDPKHLIADLEAAEHKAFVDAFPLITEHFCLFHVLQSWKKKMQTLGISKRIVFGGDMHEFWSILRCLPFGNPANVASDFEVIVDILPQPLCLPQNKFVNYLKRIYVSNNARFNSDIWNIRMSTLTSLPRTSNSVESSHRNLSGCVRMCAGRRQMRPSDLVNTLKKEAQKVQFDIETISIDPLYKVLHKRKIRDVMKDRRLEKVVDNNPAPPMQPIQGLDYFKAIRAAWRQ